MKIVHTTYFLTTALFLILATFLLTEQPIPITQTKKSEAVQPAAPGPKPKQEKPARQGELSFSGLPKVKVVATGYYAGVESTGKDKDHPQYGITYSGARVVRDRYSTIAADLNVFPLGTILYIPDYGYGVVADIGSAIKGNKIDLYFDTLDDIYKQWGKKTVDVYVVKRGEGFVNDKMIAELNAGGAIEANKQMNSAGK